jgi:hypothetical protein
VAKVTARALLRAPPISPAQQQACKRSQAPARPETARPLRGDRMREREKLGIVSQQLMHLAIEPALAVALVQGVIPRCSSPARSTLSARWKRIFAAASLTPTAAATSRKEEPRSSFIVMTSR